MNKFFLKPIFAGFVPELNGREIIKSLFYISPIGWPWLRIGKSRHAVEIWLSYYLGTRNVIGFDSGRTAILMALKALGVGSGDEVAVQAYTCAVVANSIIWSGAAPVYIDIDDNFNMNPDDLMRKISPRTKVLIIQHTFGMPADLTRLLEIARGKGLLVVEDCAHALGATYGGRKIGNFGDIGILSFGSDKVTSCIRGGAAITNNVDLAKKLRGFQAGLPEMNRIEIMRSLLYYTIFGIGKPLYHFFYIGKALLSLAHRLHIISRIIEKREKVGEQPEFFPSKLPNSLSNILLGNLHMLGEINSARARVASYYDENIHNDNIRKPQCASDPKKIQPIYLRYTVLTDEPGRFREWSIRNGIMMGDWYSSPVAPCDVLLDKMKYNIGSCPKAENFSKRSVNLPISSRLRSKDLVRIASVVNSYKI